VLGYYLVADNLVLVGFCGRRERKEGSYRSRAGALNVESITSWTISASCLTSTGERTFLIMSILTRGILKDFKQVYESYQV
jgi:hypothetical protein